jgi:hypothetical protein
MFSSSFKWRIEMKTWKKTAVSLAVTLSGGLLIAQPLFAIEPTDNNPPWGSLLFAGDAKVLECGVSPGCGFGTSETITVGDVDHFMLVCGQGKLTQVKVTLQASPYSGNGDLDIEVRKPNFALIGTSALTTQVETVNTSTANLSAVVLKVFPYTTSGANTYEVSFSCS